MNRGWWRRNVWGLVLSPLLAAGLFVLAVPGWNERNHDQVPSDPVPVDNTGQATLGAFSARIVEFGEVTRPLELEQLKLEDAPALPVTVKIWRATLDLHIPTDGAASCDLFLLDKRGRVYSEGPGELGGFLADAKHCLADDQDQKEVFISTSYFVLPADAQPDALRIVFMELKPRYIRLPVRLP